MKLAKTRMAKSVHDADWSMLRNMLSYKSIATGGVMRVVAERYSSQTCSVCGCIPAGSPKGLGALGVRQWRCDERGTLHDRDINGARNIEIAGAERRPPVAEIPALQDREDVKVALPIVGAVWRRTWAPSAAPSTPEERFEYNIEPTKNLLFGRETVSRKAFVSILTASSSSA